jgi:3-dehydroquinate dehydratase / shikimate dehydrogenase
MAEKHLTRLICSLTADTAAGMHKQLHTAVAAGVDAIEIRLDLLNAPPTDAELTDLLNEATVPVIVTYRPVREGGRYDGDEEARLAVLQRAIDLGASWVDVEVDTPLDDRPEGATILSHHDFDRCPPDLDAIAAEMDAADSTMNKIAFAAAGPEEALRAADLIDACHKPTIAVAMGESGAVSRILAGKFGAAGSFAALTPESAAAPGQLTVDQLKGLYRWDSVGPETACFGVIGHPVAHSMSPAIHNAAFTAAGVDGVYVPVLIEPGAENFGRFMDALLARPALGWRGLSVTIPHKENALAYVGPDNCDQLAVKIGAVNTITIEPDGSLRGDNTDYAAAIDALCDAMGISREALAGRVVAVLGAGGAARAIVAALTHYGASVTIYNRTVSRAKALADEFGAVAESIEIADGLQAEIIINCTPIGMASHSDRSPLTAIPASTRVVFDTIYNPIETPLLIQARQMDCRVVSGLDMFVNQAVAQFERWTDRPAPRAVMRQTVVDCLGAAT